MALLFPKSIRNYNAVYDVLRTLLANVIANECTPQERLLRHINSLEKAKNKPTNKSFSGDSFELMLADSLVYAGVPADDIFSGVKYKDACVESDLLIRKNDSIIMVECKNCLRERWRGFERDYHLFKRDARHCMSAMHEKVNLGSYREGDSFEYWLITNKESKEATPGKAIKHVCELNEHLLIAPKGSIVTVYDDDNMARFFSMVVGT